MAWSCPKCERELRNPYQWHNCVKVNIGDLFKNKAEELEYVFDRLLAEIIEWENIAVSATQKLYCFCSQSNFFNCATNEDTIGFKILFNHRTKRISNNQKHFLFRQI